MRPRLWAEATAALDRLRSSHDLVVIEGAGSPAEINLRESDIVNMAMARHANSPVILVGDIDPGGVFAQFLGTLELLEPEERALVKGLVVNKFRGDLSLLEPGLRMIESRTGVPVLGVLPWMRLSALAEEDAQPIERAPERGGAPRDQDNYDFIDIAVIRYPRIANFDDIDALSLEPGVRLRFVEGPGELGSPDAVILPGSKATMADLGWLRAQGLDDGIRWLARAGKSVVGLCGGYQMLGLEIEDKEGLEGRPGCFPGLGLLPLRTVFAAGKRVTRVRARVEGGPGFFAQAKGLEVEGYEIHSGFSALEAALDAGAPAATAPFSLRADGAEGEGKPEGAAARGGRVWGSYIHGIFDLAGFRRAWLGSLRDGALADTSAPGLSLAEARDQALEALADAAEANLDIGAIARMAGLDLGK
jgi:adenosylcobyric acid synthase